MDIFKSSYYIRCNKYLSFYGHWPYQSDKIKIRNQTLIMITIFTVFIPQIAKMIEIRHYFHYFILSIPSILYYTQFVAKNVCAFRVRKEIKYILDKIQSDFQINKEEDLEILHHYSKKATKFNKFYTVYMFTVVSAYSVLPLTLHVMDLCLPLNNVTRLPQKPRLIKYYIDTFDNNILFIILHGALTDLMAIVFVIGFDTLYLSLAYHVCGLFVILTNTLYHVDCVCQNISNKIKRKKIQNTVNEHKNVEIQTTNVDPNKNTDIYYRDFVKTVVMHKFVQTLESCFTILNLVSIGCAMVPLTITGFEVLLNKGNIGEMMRYILYAYAEMVHLFYYNWPGQKITEHSLMIYQSCYNCNWYKKEFSVESKKLMNLMMVRSQKPCYLTAGKLYILGLENFASVIKVSMSYFTVLSSVT